MASLSSWDTEGRNPSSPEMGACGGGASLHISLGEASGASVGAGGRKEDTVVKAQLGDHCTAGSDLDTAPFRPGTSAMDGHSLSEPGSSHEDAEYQ